MPFDHLDFIRTLDLNLHSLSCEAALIADNVARMGGVSLADSLALTYQLLERFKCAF